jgi:antitoxin component YwqK of YwqJK toxin-antitoxin module
MKALGIITTVFLIGFIDSIFCQSINKIDSLGLKQGEWIEFSIWPSAIIQYGEKTRYPIDSNIVYLSDKLIFDNDNELFRQCGSYCNGLKYGKWIKYFPDGILKEESFFFNGIPLGYCRFNYDNGNVGKKGIILLDSIFHFEYYEENGNFISNITQTVYDHFGDYYFPSSPTVLDGGYIDSIGLRQGKWREYRILTEEQLKQDDLPGQTQFFVSNHELLKGKYLLLQQVGNFKDGLRSGYWDEYYLDGKIRSKIFYLNGIPMGPFEFYYLNGKIKKKGSFSFNKTITIDIYDKEGSFLKTEITPTREFMNLIY